MDHYQRSARNTFAALNVDRQAELREDSQWLQQQLDSKQARFLPVHNGACLVADVLADAAQANAPLLLSNNPASEQTPVFLGQYSMDGSLGDEAKHNIFSVELPEQHPLLADENQLIGLRRAASLFNADYAGLCAYALAIHQWHANHLFCGRCGQPNQILAAGHRLQCTASDCNNIAFPRIDPAMIVLVTWQNQCLLGRQPNWPEKRYSCLAGFVEPGESLEDAVQREVMEEAGVRLGEIHYHSSQPWPFPASIMLGFTAAASDPAITVGDELEDARWWHADDIHTAVLDGELRLPYQLSISWQLMADWYLQQTGKSLADLSIQHAHR